MRAIRALAFVALACAAACSSSDYGPSTNVDGGAGDSSTCGTAITFDPTEPSANSVAPVRAKVNVVGAPGVFTYSWDVTFNGSTVTFTTAASDGSEIEFIAANPGPYNVTVQISGPVPGGCRSADGYVNVIDPTANLGFYRMRTVPPGSAPPQESVIQVHGNANYQRDILLDPGITANLAVQQSGTGAGVEAYVKLMPVSAPNAFTEVFTASNGAFTARLLGQMHTALVIPVSNAIAPALVSWSPTSTALVIGTGSVVSGVVRGPGGGGLSGARVQLTSGGVPSTTATTAIDGSFSLRTSFAAGSSVTVKVTPSAASGLPRLQATGTFNLGTSMQITYSASLATCDLANTPVRRSGTAQAGAKVTVVGTLAGTSGTVVAGVTVNATGTVRVAATADGTGKLPSMLVPRAPLSAVVALTASDFAVDPIDTSTCPAQTIDAPPLVVRTGTAKNINNTVLSGVRVEATPIGALAQADAQAITAITDGNGAFSISLASGGNYDVRFIDPYARAARLEALGIAPAGVPATATLPKALVVSGKISIAGTSQPVSGASVQMLCATCTGLNAARPVAETASSTLSEYQIAVPDPGTM